VTQKLGQISKIRPGQILILCCSLRISGHLPDVIVNVEETELEKCNFRNFTDAVTLNLTLNRVIRHTVVHHSSTCMYTPNFIEIGKTFSGRTLALQVQGHMTQKLGQI